MTRNQIIVALIVVFLLIGLNTTTIFLNQQKTNIKYVRSHEVVYGYLGMKEVQNEFELKKQGWAARLDTLQRDFQKSLNLYTKEVGKLSVQERTEREDLLRLQQGNIASYSEQINQKISSEEERLMTGVLNQVNSFAEQYAKDNGLDIVLGTTLDGSILYGSDGHDITEEFLAAMNDWYEPRNIN